MAEARPGGDGLVAHAFPLIEEWRPDHPRWTALVRVIRAEGQDYAWRDERHFARFDHTYLVALADGEIAGFLQFFRQPIGPDRECPAIALNGEELVEAKVLGFAVRPPFQRRGIGRALQTAAIHRARDLGCFQLRSFSFNTPDHAANYRLKLSMGFAAQPEYRGPEVNGVNFIMPLCPCLSGDVIVE
jgi:GNAT superfamily N-acetyltransferase